MRPFGVWVLSAVVVVGCSILGGGCGGAIAPVTGGDGGPSSGSSGSSSGGSSSGSSPNDGGPLSDAPVTIDAPVGPCQDDGVPCIDSGQCCSGVCQNQVCGGTSACVPDGASCSTASQCCTLECAGGVCGGTSPSCEPDGVACSQSSECCGGDCNGSVCGGASTCPVSSNASACDVCLAEQCCTQVVDCESDLNCENSEQCFDACYTGPGSGGACAQKCESEFPSTQGTTLEQCAVSYCSSTCD